MPVSLVRINSAYVPPGEFDYEGGIETELHGVELGVRVHPVQGAWDFWKPGGRVVISLYLSQQGHLNRCKPFVPARFQRLGRWLYQVEGMIVGLGTGETPHLAGFPEIEIDSSILVEGQTLLEEGDGLSFVGELWGGPAQDEPPSGLDSP
jgi:hypothetical protein